MLLFQTLADRSGAPAALLLRLPPDTAGDAATPAWLDDAAFLQLSSATVTKGGAASRSAPFQFFHAADEASDWEPALVAAGWTSLPADAVLPAVQGLPPALPETAHWVSGDWCLAPPAKANAGRAASQAVALQLVQLVSADADTAEIEALLRREPLLSYELLRLVNSLGVGGGRRIAGFAQAILILGRQQLRRWLNLMLFAARGDDTRAQMLLARVAVRARLMEALAKAGGLGKQAQEQAFMVGMFSLLGVLFGKPLAQLLPPLMLGDAMLAALLDGTGELGELLALVVAAERGEFATVLATLDHWQIDTQACNAMMIDAHLWMLTVVGDGGAGHA